MSSAAEVPAAVPLAEQRGETYPSLVQIMRRLLGVGGCPWDREQTYRSLRRYVLEEACEVIDAIDAEDFTHLREELGDLLLQVAFLGELARRDGRFGPDDVVQSICEKLVRRHPHVFGDVKVDGADEVVQNWEAIKRSEAPPQGVLDSVPSSLPALPRAQRLGDKASRVGFDWPDSTGPREKVAEELEEVDRAIDGGDPARIEHELGDLLFAVVNLARHHRIDAEGALRATAERFRRRFSHVESRVRQRHGGWPRSPSGRPGEGVPLAELEAYWEEAKRES